MVFKLILFTIEKLILRMLEILGYIQMFNCNVVEYYILLDKIIDILATEPDYLPTLLNAVTPEGTYFI